MPRIFDYLDYREFLRDYYAEQKARSAHFSYEAFTRKAGFKSRSLLHHILSGRRDLSKSAIFKVGEALKLNQKEQSYFQELVAFCQVRDAKEKSFHFSKMSEYAPRNPARLLKQEQYEFYSQWYTSTLREVVCLVNFKEDYALLGRLVKPAITASQAKRAVELLVTLGLVEKTRTGYRQANSAITTGDEVLSLAVASFHEQNMNLAKDSIDDHPAEERDISCLIVSLSADNFQRVKSEIQAFRKQLSKIANLETKPNRTYHINFQFFPTSPDLMRLENGK
jgi:uncharacterized protein (TIGR02147 family)